LWGGKAKGSLGRRFIDPIRVGTGARQALANGRRRGAATGSEAEVMEPLAALSTDYDSGGGGGPAGSQSGAKHRRRRWPVWRLLGGFLRQAGLSGRPPSQGRHSGGGGARCVEPRTYLIASRSSGKHRSEGINPRLRAPDPSLTNTSHRNQPRRRPINFPSRITYCRCRPMMRPAQVPIDSSHRIGPGKPR